MKKLNRVWKIENPPEVEKKGFWHRVWHGDTPTLENYLGNAKYYKQENKVLASFRGRYLEFEVGEEKQVPQVYGLEKGVGAVKGSSYVGRTARFTRELTPGEFAFHTSWRIPGLTWIPGKYQFERMKEGLPDLVETEREAEVKNGTYNPSVSVAIDRRKVEKRKSFRLGDGWSGLKSWRNNLAVLAGAYYIAVAGWAVGSLTDLCKGNLIPKDNGIDELNYKIEVCKNPNSTDEELRKILKKFYFPFVEYNEEDIAQGNSRSILSRILDKYYRHTPKGNILTAKNLIQDTKFPINFIDIVNLVELEGLEFSINKKNIQVSKYADLIIIPSEALPTKATLPSSLQLPHELFHKYCNRLSFFQQLRIIRRFSDKSRMVNILRDSGSYEAAIPSERAAEAFGDFILMENGYIPSPSSSDDKGRFGIYSKKTAKEIFVERELLAQCFPGNLNELVDNHIKINILPKKSSSGRVLNYFTYIAKSPFYLGGNIPEYLERLIEIEYVRYACRDFVNQNDFPRGVKNLQSQAKQDYQSFCRSQDKTRAR